MLSTENPIVDILIVDDRLDGLLAIEAALDIPNINLIKAQSGKEALNLLPSYDFGVILLDVQMPEMDGFTVAKEIRKLEKFKHTPIIFVTAINKDDYYVYKGYELGAVDYIFKPFDSLVLKSKVNVFVDLYIKNFQLKSQAELIRDNERKERFQKLAELEMESLKRYKNLANSVPHMIWKARADGIFVYFNEVWEDYTGLTQDQSVGLGWQSATHPEDLTYFLKKLIHSMNTGEPFEIEARLRRKDGRMRWHWIKATPDVQGDRVTAWIGTCTDIDDRKTAQLKLMEAQQMAVSASAAKTNFLANMSHEIRTPMNAILGFSELMLDPAQTEEERLHCVATIHKCGQQLLTLIDEILDISKIEAGRLDIEEIEFNLPTLLKDLLSLMQVQAESKNLKLEFKLLSKIPEQVKSDPTRLRQILLNAVGNAIKFTNKGSITVEIDYKEDKQEIKFYIKDTGIGILEKNTSKLFQPFVQVDNSTTRVFGGTGLGLFLSKKLAKALGGNLSLLKTEYGKGTTFLFELKVKVANNTTFIKKLPSSTLQKPKPIVKKSNAELNGLKILLVEDSIDNQDIISYFLTNAGAHVDVAENGIEGVDKTLKGNYNVVLMDIQMPQMDGYEATSELRKRGYTGPIIALTAHALKEEREKCLKAGYTEHMTKPVNRLTLISQIAHFASKN